MFSCFLISSSKVRNGTERILLSRTDILYDSLNCLSRGARTDRIFLFIAFRSTALRTIPLGTTIKITGFPFERICLAARNWRPCSWGIAVKQRVFFFLFADAVSRSSFLLMSAFSLKTLMFSFFSFDSAGTFFS